MEEEQGKVEVRTAGEKTATQSQEEEVIDSVSTGKKGQFKTRPARTGQTCVQEAGRSISNLCGSGTWTQNTGAQAMQGSNGPSYRGARFNGGGHAKGFFRPEGWYVKDGRGALDTTSRIDEELLTHVLLANRKTEEISKCSRNPGMQGADIQEKAVPTMEGPDPRGTTWSIILDSWVRPVSRGLTHVIATLEGKRPQQRVKRFRPRQGLGFAAKVLIHITHAVHR